MFVMRYVCVWEKERATEKGREGKRKEERDSKRKRKSKTKTVRRGK